MNRKALPTSGIIACIAFLLALTASAFAVGSIEKGDWVLYQVTQQTGTEPAQSFTRKETVKDITAKEVVLLHEINENGVLTKREVRIALNAEYNKLQFSSLVLPKGKNLTEVAKGQESLVIKGAPLACTWETYEIQAERNRQSVKTTFKRWTSPKIPIGQTVRQETHAENMVDGKPAPIHTTTVLLDYHLAPRVAPLEDTTVVPARIMGGTDTLLPLSMPTNELMEPSLSALSEATSDTLRQMAQATPRPALDGARLPPLPGRGRSTDAINYAANALDIPSATQTPSQPQQPTAPIEMLPGGAILPQPATPETSTAMTSYISASSEKTYTLGEATKGEKGKTIGTGSSLGVLELQFTATKIIYGPTSSVSLILHIPTSAAQIVSAPIRVYSGNTLLGEATPSGSTVEIPLSKDLLPQVEQWRLNVRSTESTGMLFSSQSSGYGARLKITSGN